MRLEQRILHVYSPLYCWDAAVLHVPTRLLWVSSGSGDPVQAGGDWDGNILQLRSAPLSKGSLGLQFI